MLNVEWCSICCSKPSVGTATVNDGTGVLTEIGLCEDCYKKIAPDAKHYSIGW